MCASAVIIRHLGVVDTGRYVTVLSLIVIAGSISDLGLGAVGVRAYAVTPHEERHQLLRNVLGMRLAFVVPGVALATAFAALAGYTDTMVVGTVIAGVGLSLLVIQQSLAVPLYAHLRFGAVAGLSLLIQAGVAITATLLALAGAGLLAFFAVQVPIMLPVVALAVLVGGRETRALPAFDAPVWRRLARQILPFSAAVVLSVLYFRVAQIMVSLLSGGEEAGFFAVPFRVLDALTAVPALLVSTALPVLARSARDDAERFANAGRRLAEVMLMAGVGLALVLFLGAGFCIDVIAGAGFERSVDILRILALALVGTFMLSARGYALLSLDRMRAILISNAVALVVVAVAGIPLTHTYGAVGAASTLLAAEFALAVCYEVALTHNRPDLRPSLSLVGRVLLAAAIATLLVLFLGLSSPIAAVTGGVTYLAALVLLRTIPPELLRAIWRRPLAEEASR